MYSKFGEKSVKKATDVPVDIKNAYLSLKFEGPNLQPYGGWHPLSLLKDVPDKKIPILNL